LTLPPHPIGGMMTEEELRDFEKFADQIAVMSSPSIAAGMRRLIAEVKMLKKGEYICIRCGIRKNADPIEANF
jgi:hypothetical protein